MYYLELFYTILFNIYFFEKKLVYITLAEFLFRCYWSLRWSKFISLDAWNGSKEGILINCKKQWIISFKLRKKIKRANRLYDAQLLATKSGEVTPYRRSVFEERIRKTQKEMKLKDSKN